MKTGEQKSVQKMCCQNVFRLLCCREKKPLDQTTNEIVQFKSSVEHSAVEEARCILPIEIKQTGLSVVVPDKDICGPLTATSVEVGCSDSKPERMIFADEVVTMPDKMHGVDEKRLVQLKKKVR